jgi:hypothetical protein
MILVILTNIYGSWRKDHQRMHNINISEEPSSGYSEDGKSRCFQNSGIYIPNYTASHSRRF